MHIDTLWRIIMLIQKIELNSTWNLSCSQVHHNASITCAQWFRQFFVSCNMHSSQIVHSIFRHTQFQTHWRPSVAGRFQWNWWQVHYGRVCSTRFLQVAFIFCRHICGRKHSVWFGSGVHDVFSKRGRHHELHCQNGDTGGYSGTCLYKSVTRCHLHFAWNARCKLQCSPRFKSHVNGYRKTWRCHTGSGGRKTVWTERQTRVNHWGMDGHVYGLKNCFVNSVFWFSTSFNWVSCSST